MDKNQLVEEIASRTDEKDYRLILDLNGVFRLIDLDDWEENLIYVTKWETYDSGNGYVGIDASKDIRFIDSIYSWAEEAWDRYKNNEEIRIPNLNT